MNTKTQSTTIEEKDIPTPGYTKQEEKELQILLVNVVFGNILRVCNCIIKE